MRYLLLFLTAVILFQSCGDKSEDKKNCNCKSWQICKNDKCVTAQNKCENNSDCPLNYICNEDHVCTEDDLCRPECDESWQECKDKRCIVKEGFCLDDTMCLNGYYCDNETHKCISSCNEYFDECNEGENICSGFNKIKRCMDTDCGRRLKEFECENGKGCFKGECMPFKCSDECGPDKENCKIWDIKEGKFVNSDQNNSLYDKNVEYLKWLYKENMFFGGVAEAFFQTENLENKIYLGGIGDSAIWTGTYLAAEAFRYMVTGSKNSFENIKKLIKTLHLWFNIAKSDGLLVRFAAETELLNNSSLSGDLKDCEPNNSVYCNIEYNGKLYTYKGHISRDQYQGVLLGYSLAYSALGNTRKEKELKELIRADIVKLIKQIMKKTTIKVKYEIYDDRIPAWLGGSPLRGTKTVNLRFIVVSPDELNENSEAVVKICSPGHSPQGCETNFWGFQEFMPDLKPFLSQLTNVLNFIPVIPRAGSAVMLSNIFNTAMQVTENTDRELYEEIKNFYYGNNDEWENVNSWLDSAEQWKYLNKCGEKYYGINITMEPLYNLMRLEKNESIRQRIIDNVLSGKIWKEIKNHKNVFFDYIYLTAFENTDEEILNAANEQFLQFPLTPKLHHGVNLLNETEYPQYASREEGCSNQVSHEYAVDVKDRVMSDFIWQRNPWQLYSEENLKHVYPGVDYLIVYWMGRYYNFINEEDNKCLRFKD